MDEEQINEIIELIDGKGFIILSEDGKHLSMATNLDDSLVMDLLEEALTQIHLKNEDALKETTKVLNKIKKDLH